MKRVQEMRRKKKEGKKREIERRRREERKTGFFQILLSLQALSLFSFFFALFQKRLLH
jgi:hypothetical protein